jgi:hypothetical protein
VYDGFIPKTELSGLYLRVSASICGQTLAHARLGQSEFATDELGLTQIRQIFCGHTSDASCLAAAYPPDPEREIPA